MKQKFAVVHRPDETSRQLKDELAGMIVNKTKRKPMILPLLMTADL